MAKNKGKKRGDQPKQPAAVNEAAASPPPLTIPPPAQQAFPVPKQGRDIPRIETNDLHFAKAVSPKAAQHEVLSSGTHDWPSQGQLGGWGENNEVQNGWAPDDEHYGDDDDEEDYGEDDEYEDDDLRSGSGTHTSPAMAAGPTAGHLRGADPGAWGMSPALQRVPSPQNPKLVDSNPHMANGHGPINPHMLQSAIAGIGDMGFGSRPDPAAPEPTLRRKNTLKKHPHTAHTAPEPFAPAPPAKHSKHVAFGGLTDVLHSITHRREPPAPSPALATSVAPGLLSNRPPPSHRQPPGAFGTPATDTLPFSLGIPGGQPSAQSPWGQAAPSHLHRHAVSPAVPAKNPYAAANPMAPPSTNPYSGQAWTKWSSEAKGFGMPAVATTMKASVPTTAFPPSVPAPPPPVPQPAAPGNPALAAMMGNPAFASLIAAQQAQAQGALKDHNTALAAMGVSPQGQMPQPARHGPATPQATWKYFQEKGHLPTPQSRLGDLYGQPQRPAHMQAASGRGNDWAAGGGAHANVGGWGQGAADPAAWGGGGGGGGGAGGWGQGAADPAAWGGGGGGGNVGEWGADSGAATAHDGWGDAGKAGNDPWSNPTDASAWGAPETSEHRGRDKKHKHRHDPSGKSGHRHKHSPDVGRDAGGWGGSDGANAGRSAAAAGGYGRGDASGRGLSHDAGEWGASHDNGGWGQGGGEDFYSAKPKDKHSKHHNSSKNDSSWGRTRMEEVPEEEEEEYYDDYDDYDDEDDEDDLESMYTEPKPDGYRAAQPQSRRNPHISPRISYALSPAGRSHPLTGGTPHLTAGTPHLAGSSLSPGKHRHEQGLGILPDPNISQTMNIATGWSDAVPIPSGKVGSEAIPIANGKAIEPARRALFFTKAVDPEKARPAKDRIHWMFNPEMDPRVASLLRWVDAMSEQLAFVGLTFFLQTNQRGALVANAEYRKDHAGMPMQPVFDWITLQDASNTLDSTLQRSILRYNPAEKAVVFVYLLSRSGNSMAMWRRKCPIPEGVRERYQGVIDRAVQSLDTRAVILVDELPPPKPPAEPAKKRSWWKRIFLFWKKK